METIQPLMTELAITDALNSIIIAEDCEFNLTALNCILQTFNLKADLVMNGRDALNAVVNRLNQGAEMYKLIVLDFCMPELDGPQAASKILEAIHEHNENTDE